MIAALLGVVLAAEHHVLRPGETIETLAGSPAAAGEIRRLNEIPNGALPVPGTVLLLPDPPGAPPQEAVVLSVFGSAWSEPPSGPRSPLSPGSAVPPGARVCTDEDSFATLRLAVDPKTHQHDDINLLSRTCITVQAMASSAEGHSTLIDLRQGSVTVRNVAPEGEPGLVTVRTPDAVASARGGSQRVHVESGATRAEALYNPLQLYGGGQELVLSAGQGSRVLRGQAPSAPIELSLPGTPLYPSAGSVLRTPDFGWTPAESVLGYRVEIALDSDFSELVLIDETFETTFEPGTLLIPYRDGGFYWRLSSVDRAGFVGIPSDPMPLLFPPGVSP